MRNKIVIGMLALVSSAFFVAGSIVLTGCGPKPEPKPTPTAPMICASNGKIVEC